MADDLECVTRCLIRAVTALIPAALRAQGGADRRARQRRRGCLRAWRAWSTGSPIRPARAVCQAIRSSRRLREGALKGADSTRIVVRCDACWPSWTSRGTRSDRRRRARNSSRRRARCTRASRPPNWRHVAQIGGTRRSGGAARSDRLVMPLVVLADLVARRVSADVAVSSLETLLTRAAPDAEFASLRAAIERDIASGTSPDAAMRAQSAAVVRTLDGRGGARPPEE